LPFEAQEELVGLLVVDELREVVGLEEVEVEVAWRLGGGSLIWGAHEQVSRAITVFGRPREVVLPDAVAGDVGIVADAECLFHGHVVRRVELVVVEAVGSLRDELVVVDVLGDIEVDLAVVFVATEELARHRRQRLGQDRLDRGAQEDGVLLGQSWREEAQLVAELVHGQPDSGMDVVGGEPVDR